MGELRADGAIERELKYALQPDDYSTLKRALSSKSKTVRQVNYYFDDPKLKLRKRRFGLRIRILDGAKAILTLKHPAKSKNQEVRSLKVRKEYETRIPFRLAKDLLRGKRKMGELDYFPIKILRRVYGSDYLSKIVPLGAIRTLRTKVRLEPRVELELDRFDIFESRFYELEVETNRPKATDRTIRKLLEEHDIPYHPITKSKLARFLAHWKKQ